MPSDKGSIERECADCGEHSKRGRFLARIPAPGVRVSVWVCRQCGQHDQDYQAALRALERRTLGVVKRFG